MSSINTSLRIRCPALIKRYALDHIKSALKKKKERKKTQKRVANFLASAESAGESDSLITPFIIKPGYLPEQPASHVPGESARHFHRDSGRSYSAEISERKAIGSPFRTWVSRSEDKRKGRGADCEPETWREEVEMEPKSITRGNVDLDVFQHQCQPMSN